MDLETQTGRLFKDGAYTDEHRWVRAEVYESAVKGRREFRQAYRDARAALQTVYKLAGGHATECQCRQCEIFEFLEPIVGNTSDHSAGVNDAPK